ncbi:LPS export ABC transporter permease LptF [Futiania mangrovi]|uniref:LPS export ABC transporter permease LptF n=1 Tax=Futiania mangrovi TaxID=2959716 RepID=A0A9J6P9Q3_9PROT|nr:LPS export ABC transporter permease LptF [Futiania mangrovii]MCP1335653.1 LPS export ABC transporter permease LptF [Futiania mangrovii]
MGALFRYLFRQVLLPFVFFTLVLSVVIWLTQSLRILDVILNKGQSAITFLEIAALLMPKALVVVLPISLFCAVLYALHRLATESELVVIWAAGRSSLGIAAPVLMLGVLVTLVLYAFTLYLVPASARASRDKLFEIQTDLAAAVLEEGVFSTPVAGLTVYIREMRRSGEMLGIMVHDNRTPEAPVTYMAGSGALLSTGEGPRLVMLNGTIQRVSTDGRLDFLDFERYSYDLAQFAQATNERALKPSEQFIGELFFPEGDLDATQRWRLAAEGHEQLSTPLYALMLASVGICGLLGLGSMRRGMGTRILVIVAVAVVIRLSGLALQNLAVRIPPIIVLTYAWPLAATVVPMLLLAHGLPAWAKPRRRKAA